MTLIGPTTRTTHKRVPQRGSHDRALIESILDEGLVCHVGFVHEGQPFVIPTTYARIGDRLYLHGAVASRMLSTLADGVPVCVEVTLLDGLVLARSAAHHSMNYRSVLVLGTAREVTDLDEKRRALEAFVEHAMPGRLEGCRRPGANEVAGTRVVVLPIGEASAKVRTGPPLDTDDDRALPYWAGEVPLRLTPGAPVPDPALPADVAVPPAVARYRR